VIRRLSRLRGVLSYLDDEDRRVWEGAELRVVHAKRARTLRRRGEEVIDTGERTRRGKHVLAWFVEIRS
jgi:hypothetical protein